MDEKLRLLLRLQSIDMRLDEIKREREGAPKQLERVREELDLLKKAAEQDLSTLEELTEERRSVERELDEVEAKYKKSKLKLDGVKSNKEYQAVLKELEDIKELTNEKEELVIKCMEEIEIQEKEYADNNTRLDEAQRGYVDKERQFEEKMKGFEREVFTLNEERAKLAQELDGDLLGGYNRLRGHLKGRVVVPVINAVCQGCHLGVPPQQYNTLMRGDSTQICLNCTRIIYWEDSSEI